MEIYFAVKLEMWQIMSTNTLKPTLWQTICESCQVDIVLKTPEGETSVKVL